VKKKSLKEWLTILTPIVIALVSTLVFFVNTVNSKATKKEMQQVEIKMQDQMTRLKTDLDNSVKANMNSIKREFRDLKESFNKMAETQRLILQKLMNP